MVSVMMSKEDFFKSIREGDISKVRECISQDKDIVNQKSEGGMSAVITAMYYGHPDVAELLVAQGAKLDIFEASALGKAERIDELLRTEHSLVRAYSSDGFTPLHLAVFFRNREATKHLISNGADVNAVAKNPMRVAPLHSAAAGNDSEIIRLLVENGADINSPQQGGYTALHAAALNGNLEVAEILLSRGAKIDATTQDGKTPLALTKEGGREAGPREDREKVARLLRLRGAVV